MATPSPALRSPLTVLEHSARAFATLPAFRVAGKDGRWSDITYAAFLADVERIARFWTETLQDVPARAVVGVWLRGTAYADVVHSYALARAGFVPQYMSARLPPAAVLALMYKAGAAALVYDADAAPDGCPVLAFPARSPDAIAESGVKLPALDCGRAGNETFCIFHTSGSTGATPKLVPCSLDWMDAAVAKSELLCKRRNPAKQDVANIISSGMHMAQSFTLIGVLANGGCSIEPRSIPFSPADLVGMVRDAGMTILRTFGTFLATYVRDTQALAALQTLDEVCYSGIALPGAEETLARAHGVKLRNVFGSTELGGMMYSPDGEAHLQPVPGTKYDFREIAEDGEEDSGEGEGKKRQERLLELFVRRDSPDRPIDALCDAHGEFCTGDLFRQVGLGKYEYRGRADDWIKTAFARIDTCSIEENVRTTCGDLVQDCVVVGWRRPAPVLVLEPRVSGANDEQTLKAIIVARIAPFDELKYTQERISDPRLLVIATEGTLPRTTIKGNIRRRAVEEQFKDVLDAIFG
ncbi:acetyl-CoA synthetase-like protein [Auricularia subglabra TFB-10046 SS5]|nr:acetyl-CoA synthetase-like protein [Auricularia subglabra TFB-10046 SS5]